MNIDRQTHIEGAAIIDSEASGRFEFALDTFSFHARRRPDRKADTMTDRLEMVFASLTPGAPAPITITVSVTAPQFVGMLQTIEHALTEYSEKAPAAPDDSPASHAVSRALFDLAMMIHSYPLMRQDVAE